MDSRKKTAKKITEEIYDSGKEAVVARLLEYDSKIKQLEQKMDVKAYRLQLPAISEEEKNPLVSALSDIIEKQQANIQKLYEANQLMKNEIARMKKQNEKPKIKPSKLTKNRKSGQGNRGEKRSGSAKRPKTVELEIHTTKIIEPDHIPEGSKFKHYKNFVVQDIILKTYNTKYRLKVYVTPDGSTVRGVLPKYLQGKHFGGELICFCIYQHHHCGVTQPLLLEQLLEIGVNISSGQLNNILTENKAMYHEEKQRILDVGLKFSQYINVDDTGARHNGKNGYCTHIGNDEFSWFESTDSKSRINFLTLLRGDHTDYHINEQAIAYMEEAKLPKCIQKIMDANIGIQMPEGKSWLQFLKNNNIEKKRHIKIITEGALMGSIIKHGIADNLAVISDAAGQFAILIHALCWIHAERLLAKLTPVTEEAIKDLEDIRSRIWDFYDKLKEYKKNPAPEFKKQLEDEFYEIFTTHTASPTLNDALQRLYSKKDELLLVLDRPEIPLHNNSAENAIREYVKKRKISGGTRSDEGRKCRDTFTTLKKTCRKQGVTFWQYLKDRVFQKFLIPDLSDLIRQKSEN